MKKRKKIEINSPWSKIKMLLLVFFANSQLTQAQKSGNYTLKLTDTESKQPIPYAHISSGGNLVTMTDFYGNFQLQKTKESKTYLISCIGYESLKINKNDLEALDKNTIMLKPSQKVLDAVIITPTSLQDMIAEAYHNIPNAYVSESHLLTGNLSERYMDTLGHVHISSHAKLQVQKKNYSKKTIKGEVKIDSISRSYDIQDTLYAKIYAGAHIPHRFDFVMRRDDFINPNNFNKYNYSYQGEWEYLGRKADVIGFEPKGGGVTGGHYRGKLYLDAKEKVFVKAAYSYTKSGFINNRPEQWADQRMFITEYAPDADGWHISYTWDEAVRKKDNFLLSQYFQTTEIQFDTLTHWNYEEKIHFQDVVGEYQTDSLEVIEGVQSISTPVVYERSSKMAWVRKIEVGLVGLKLFSLNQNNLLATGNLSYQGKTIALDQSFDIPQMDVGIFLNIRYRIGKSTFLAYDFSENFVKNSKRKHWDLSLLHRINLHTTRPSNLNISLGYSEFKTTFRFDKHQGLEPIYEKKEQGGIAGMNYEIRLNPKWKVGIGYNYFVNIGSKEKFYLKEKYGLFNMFSKKHDYPIEEVSWQVNGEAVSELPKLFGNHSLDISLVMAFQ